MNVITLIIGIQTETFEILHDEYILDDEHDTKMFCEIKKCVVL